MKINKEWHEKNPMPKNVTFGQRAQWHLEHSKHCACRRISQKMAQEMKDKGFDVPENFVEPTDKKR